MLHGWPIGACLRCRPIGATAASRHQCRMVTLGLVPYAFAKSTRAPAPWESTYNQGHITR